MKCCEPHDADDDISISRLVVRYSSHVYVHKVLENLGRHRSSSMWGVTIAAAPSISHLKLQTLRKNYKAIMEISHLLA
jgi:hypothetical protein